QMKLWAVLFAVAVVAAGQTEPQTEERRVQVIRHVAAGVQPAPGAPGADVLRFVSSEFAWSDKLVKNAPYSAEAVTETTQILADGNRIVNKSSALVYRDSDGRTRREQTLTHIGPWASQSPQTRVFLNDPVAGVGYILEPENQIARKIARPPRLPEEKGLTEAAVPAEFHLPVPPPPQGEASNVMFVAAAGSTHSALSRGSAEYKTESLGKQSIEGVTAEGNRTTTTIPAGEIGNERPIVTVSERWYSAELQTIVLTKQNDPRFGETTYRLTNIQRAEPPQPLFEPPPGYTIQDQDKMIQMFMKKKDD
ncbi:MAG TPA: hypothetical protein VLE22_12395, partial [Bryobacteraceae bacterium]|nr:hypothetical protein [Bryobacteraceae bacterium]